MTATSRTVEDTTTPTTTKEAGRGCPEFRGTSVAAR